MKTARFYTICALGVLSCLSAVTLPVLAQYPVVFRGSEWKYDDSGVGPFSPTWRTRGFDDSGWDVGLAALGYDENREYPVETRLSYGPDPDDKHPTVYFRKEFIMPTCCTAAELRLFAKVDDGFVAYINGAEVLRSNMPEDRILFRTLAEESVEADEFTEFDISSAIERLDPGDNVLAVEVHQWSRGSTDLLMDMELVPSYRMSGGMSAGFDVTLPLEDATWGQIKAVMR